MNATDRSAIVPAIADDAEALAKLIDIAGEGIPSWLWRQSAAPDQSALDIGIERAQRETGGFSYKNAAITRVGPVVAGMLLGYPIEQAPEDDPDDLPAPIAPFVALEKQSVGTWYINALAVFPAHRGQGLGASLLDHSEMCATQAGLRDLSIQVYAQNHGAVRLYTRHGYRVVAKDPVREHPCQPYYTGDVLLLKKRLA